MNLHRGKIEDAVVKAVIQDADGTKLQVDVVGLDLTALLNGIDRAHDWHRGKASQWEVCGTKTDSFCGGCGLRWTAYRDGNHSADFDVFETAKGERRTLREVSELESCVVRAE